MNVPRVGVGWLWIVLYVYGGAKNYFFYIIDQPVEDFISCYESIDKSTSTCGLVEVLYLFVLN
jgi:hypothetical protein